MVPYKANLIQSLTPLSMIYHPLLKIFSLLALVNPSVSWFASYFFRLFFTVFFIGSLFQTNSLGVQNLNFIFLLLSSYTFYVLSYNIMTSYMFYVLKIHVFQFCHPPSPLKSLIYFLMSSLVYRYLKLNASQTE